MKLSNSGVCIDHGLHKKNHFFISDFSGDDLQKIASLGLTYDILINDVVNFIKIETSRNLILNQMSFVILEMIITILQKTMI